MSGGHWKEMFAAAVAGDLALVQYHVRSGVDINYAHPEFLSTPLVAAILAGQEEVALYLLHSGADPNLPSEFDSAAPMQAARRAGLTALEARVLELGAAPLPSSPPSPPSPGRRSWLVRWWTRATLPPGARP